MKICPKCLGRHDDQQAHCPADGTELRHIHSGADSDDKMLGRVLDGRWLIEEKIGEGGMGAVYRGQQTSVGRQVAIKTLRGVLADTDEYVERFFREANVASTLNHPNCVTIYDFGQDTEDHVLYLAMEYLDGQELSQLLYEGSLPLGDALTIGVQICSALAAAHRASIVHRDLKPENIFLTNVPGDELFIKVLDFGIAKNLDAKDTGVTRTGQIFGTPAYMSPEQCQSAGVDPRSDLYSLGVILYELVSGRLPFGGDTPLKTLLAHVSRDAEPPSQLGFAVPAGVEAIIMRLLGKDPGERFQEALDVRDALAAELEVLSNNELQAAPAHDAIERDKQARATTGTLMFGELVADGGQDLVDLEQVSRNTAVFEQDDTCDPAAPMDAVDDASSAVDPNSTDASASGESTRSHLSWTLMVLVVLGLVATWIALGGGSEDTPSPAPPVTLEPSFEPALEAAASSEEMVAVEIAADRVTRAVDSGAGALAARQPRAGELRPSDGKKVDNAPAGPQKRTRPKKAAATKSSDKRNLDKGTSALVPVLTQAGARRIIASHNDEITACFEKGLLRDADFGGLIEVRMVIAADGTVANTDVVKSTVDASDVESCVVARVKSWTFPETGDGRVKILTTPFRFQAPDINKK